MWQRSGNLARGRTTRREELVACSFAMHRQLIATKGRMGWQKASGYNNKRATVEAAIGRFCQVSRHSGRNKQF
jgi:hypothetical protein